MRRDLAKNLQGLLSQSAHLQIATSMKQNAPDETLARLSSLGAPGSSSLLTLSPHLNDWIDDKSFELAIKMRLGLPSDVAGPVNCRCGKNITADPYHHLNCNLNSGMITLRHNRLVQTLSDIAKQAGAATSIEPRVPHTNSIRPDLKIALDGLFYSVDVSVVNPLAPSFLRTAKRHSLAVAEIKAKQKKTKYSEQAKSWNAAFFPFVLQVTGGFHQDARELLQLLSESPLVKDSAAFLKEARYKAAET